MAVDYREGEAGLPVDAFIGLARRIWEREYDLAQTTAALRATINVGAWSGGALVGSVRVLSDGYLFSTLAEIMVAPEFRRQGVGRELLRRALDATPGGLLYVAAQPGDERFYEQAGFRRGPVGYVGRRG